MASNFNNQTEAARAGLNLTVDPIDNFVYAGLQRRIFEVLEVPSVISTTQDDSDETSLQRLFGTENQGGNDTKSVKYPYGLLRVQSIDRDLERGNVGEFMRRGVLVTPPTESGSRAFRASVCPAIFSIQFRMVTNSFRELNRKIPILLQLSQRGWLNFNVLYGRVSISVAVRVELPLQVPSREGAAGTLQEYKMDIPLRVSGFSSIPTLIEQQIVKQVNIENWVGPEGGYPGIDGSEKFWAFNPKAAEAVDGTLAPGHTTKDT